MSIGEHIIYRRVAPLLLIFTFVLAIATLGATYANGRADRRRDHAITVANAERTKDNADNAVTSCENSNEARQASRTLWNFALSLSLAGNEDATAAELNYLGQIRTWINKVYQEHDCSALDTEYPLPPPPTIPATP